MADQTIWSLNVQRLADIIGAAGAARLVDEFGGTEKNYIPKKPTLDHRLSKLIGFESLKLLSAEFGGTSIEIPRGVMLNKKAEVIERIERGECSRKIARETAVTQRYVRIIRCELREIDTPDDLFN